MGIFSQLKNENGLKGYINDIVAGIIVALVSIPISMGYAGIAGLPVIYGLYGSILPILIFSFISSSKQFVVGVDAMPAVMLAGVMVSLGISAETDSARQLAVLMSILVAIWFVVFYIFKAGRVVKFISKPVMGGFISGVGTTIILMQVPKLFGGNAGTGELFDLLKNILSNLNDFNVLSCVLGLSTVIIILVMKKIMPKLPMTALMLVIGGALQAIFHLDRYGVKLLPEVAITNELFIMPDFKLAIEHNQLLVFEALSIALVIMAQTLLASGNYALKNGDKLNTNRELLAYAAMNVAGAAVGCLPVNGSVSRSGIADSFKARSQVMSISASVCMGIILLVGTPLFKYLPVPILTGIVMTALIGILEIDLCKKLWNTSKNEWLIFMAAFAGVLLYGTVNGVLIGVLLAFFDMVIRSVSTPTSFLGRIPGQGNYHVLGRNSKARPIKSVVIYRFSGSLFFGNIDRFQDDIESAIKTDTKIVVVDARGIGNMDITAIDRIVMINESLKRKGISFYLTEHDGSLNDLIRKTGAEHLINSGTVRRTISLALRDAGLHKPYILEDDSVSENMIDEADEKLPEFEWAFGLDATDKMESLAMYAAENIVESSVPENSANEVLDGHGVNTKWGHIGLYDENEFLDYLEIRLHKFYEKGKLAKSDFERIKKHIEEKRIADETHMGEINPHGLELMRKHRAEILEHIKEKYPEEYQKLQEIFKQREK